MLPATPLKMVRPPLRLLLRTLPDRLHSEVFARLFNHLLKGQYMAEQLDELEGKRLCRLYIKNLLDALDFDWDAHFEAVLGARLGPLAGRAARRLKLEQRIGGNALHP